MPVQRISPFHLLTGAVDPPLKLHSVFRCVLVNRVRRHCFRLEQHGCSFPACLPPLPILIVLCPNRHASLLRPVPIRLSQFDGIHRLHTSWPYWTIFPASCQKSRTIFAIRAHCLRASFSRLFSDSRLASSASVIVWCLRTQLPIFFVQKRLAKRSVRKILCTHSISSRRKSHCVLGLAGGSIAGRCVEDHFPSRHNFFTRSAISNCF